MRRLLPPSLLVALPIVLLQASFALRLEAQAPLEPILAEAPANAPDLAAAPTSVPASPTGAPASTKLSYSSCNVEGQFVAMTFDDGPHAQHTPRLLDILKQRGIKATFFVVGQNAADNPEILKRIVAEGHELANHSYTHPLLASMGESALREQLDKTHQVVLNATGVSMKVMRPPYGALSEPQRRWTHANFGYRIILWDVDPLDWKFRDAGKVETAILGHAKAGSIILAHDIHKSTVDAMPSTLDALVAKGFKFATVSELLAMDRPAAPKTAPAAPKTAAVSAEESTEPAAPVAAAVPAPAPKTTPKKRDREDAPKDAPKKKVADAKESKDAKPASRTPSKETASSEGTKKPVLLTEEELRKKWLQGTSQR